MSGDSNDEPDTRTLGNEDRLPAVPLPTLQDSCHRFLEWCAPLLTADELATTRTAVAAFVQPDSPAWRLQAALQRFGDSPDTHSWLDAFWSNRYLARRDRIALNANFFFLFEDADLGQIHRAAALIAAAVDYKRLVDEQRIPQTIERGRPLSMEQAKFLFSTTRIPGTLQDTVRAPFSNEWPGPSQARHIIVFYRGNMFRMDVISVEGRSHTAGDLAAGLGAVMATGTSPAAPGTAVGHLTTQARADWAQNRLALLACHSSNAQALDTIETALFCMSLEEVTPNSTREACALLLHGDGGNRWFDKSMSLIVYPDGTAGINAEHSRLDGTAVVSFIEHLLTQTAEENGLEAAPEEQDVSAIDAVTFVVDEDLQRHVQAAAVSFAEHAANTATSVLSIRSFGVRRAKQLRVSPDAFVQLCYQLAHRRTRGRLGATYESVATRQYRHGRTEAMRVVTPEVVHFVAVMDDPAMNTTVRRAAFRAAAEKHVKRARECQTGQAPEQHLWELQLMQQRHGEELGVTQPLNLYNSPGWRIMRDDYLSTSSTPSTHIQYSGFGSTSDHCIGIAYMLLADRLNIHLSSPGPIAAEMHLFMNELRNAIGELRDLLSNGGTIDASACDPDRPPTALHGPNTLE